MNEQPPPPDPTAAPSPYDPPAYDPGSPYQQPYAAPAQPSHSAPDTYGAPGQPPYGAPDAYGTPGQSPYGAPDAYGAPGQSPYGAPDAYGTPGQPSYGSPDAYGAQGQPQYGAPGQPGYSVPGQPGYGAPGQPGYGAQGGYGAPGPGGAYSQGGGYPPPGAPGYPYAQGGFGGAPGHPYGNQPQAGTNGFAIAALVLGVLALVPFAVVCGIVALVQIGRTGARGRGLAIGGLVAAGLWVLLVCGLGTIGAIVEEDPAQSLPGAAAPGLVYTPVQLLSAGTCVDDVIDLADVVDELPVVPCTEPHEGEVFATFVLPKTAWPGDATVTKRAETGCDSRWEQYTSRVDTSIRVIFLTPGEDNWSTDRGVTCIATSSEGSRTGSLRD